MSSDELSHRIAEKLSVLWALHKQQGQFKAYVADVYRRSIGVMPVFDGLYIGECEEGDVQKASLGGILSKLWLVDDTGISPQRRLEIVESDEDEFYKRPMVRIFLGGGSVVVGERLGLLYVCRKRGTIRMSDGEPEICDLTTLWTVDTLG